MTEKQRTAELPPHPKTTRSLKAIVSNSNTYVEQSRQNQPSQLAAAKKKIQYQHNRQHMSYFEYILPSSRKIRMMLNIKEQRQTQEEMGIIGQQQVATLEDDKTERSVSHSRPAANRLSLVTEQLTQLPSKRRHNLTSEAPPHNESLERPMQSLKHTLTTKKHLNPVKSELVKYHTAFESVCEQPLASFSELQLGETLGVGAGATVRLAVDRATQQCFAVKIYEKYKLLEPRKMKSVRRQIKLLQSLHHDNIVGLLNTYESKRQIHLIMEYFEGVTLLQFFRRRYFNLAVDEVKLIIKQLLLAVEEMHRSAVAHRDIKLDNILVSQQAGELKLIDFGFATSTLTKSEVNCGTPNYMSPELYEKVCNYSPDKVDIWAVGVCAFYLIEGGYPFRGYDEKDLARKVREGRYTVRKGDQAFSEFLELCLEVNPENRATARKLLHSQWLSSSSRMDIEHLPSL